MKILSVLTVAALLIGCGDNSADATKAKTAGAPHAAARTPAAHGASTVPTQIVNGDFEQTAEDGSIPGWSQTQHAGPTSYEMRVEADGAYQGKSFHMRRTQEQVYGSLTQALNLSAYAGKTVELSAMLKTRDVGKLGWKIFLSAPGAAQRSPGLTGTTDWQRQSVSARLPADAHHVIVGVTLNDAGEGWMDNIELKVLD